MPRLILQVLALWMAVLGLPLLSACNALPTAARLPSTPVTHGHPDSFAIHGRFTLTHQEKNYVGRLNWQHDGPHDTLILSSPLGQALAEIVSDPSGARMTQSNGQIHLADSAAQLIETLLGYPLPLDKLVDWLRGNDHLGDRRTIDVLGRVSSRQSEAWQIDYEYDDENAAALPARLFIERADGLRLRLRIEQWATPPASEISR